MMVTRKHREKEELLRREISSIILRELNDPRLGFATVTRVTADGEFRTAKVYLMLRGSEKECQQTINVLAHARGRIQGLVASRIKLRNTPVLEFVEDEEMLEALRVDRLIDEVMEEQRKRKQKTDDE
ncbi:MAG: 30S ribosome-binding factor RbfA [Candidatus Brocadiia bacterium]